MNAEPREFNDVTLYMPGFWSNIERIDAKWARIWVGPHAQHRECAQCECIEKGKRKLIRPDCGEYLVVVPTTHAIQPDELYLPFVDGASSSPARYGIGDKRWRTDFDRQLLSSDVPILVEYRSFPSDAVMEAPSNQGSEIAVSHAPDSPNEPARGRQGEGADFECEEGIRHQAERSFFQRNPQLARQAKEACGCVCKVCGFDFAETYGVFGKGFAEVHHLNPLSERPPEEWTEVIRTNLADVTVLCANCHRMIHRRRPALSIEELRAMILADTAAERLG